MIHKTIRIPSPAAFPRVACESVTTDFIPNWLIELAPDVRRVESVKEVLESRTRASVVALPNSQTSVESLWIQRSEDSRAVGLCRTIVSNEPGAGS